mmetsp:Transcript_7478/g.22704  ORF Transcript_7478/g.22704 Transcript_7478/m.22704 type:complete len:257 (-) Transcript_7478:565-1335(-)
MVWNEHHLAHRDGLQGHGGQPFAVGRVHEHLEVRQLCVVHGGALHDDVAQRRLACSGCADLLVVFARPEPLHGDRLARLLVVELEERNEAVVALLPHELAHKVRSVREGLGVGGGADGEKPLAYAVDVAGNLPGEALHRVRELDDPVSVRSRAPLVVEPQQPALDEAHRKVPVDGVRDVVGVNNAYHKPKLVWQAVAVVVPREVLGLLQQQYVPVKARRQRRDDVAERVYAADVPRVATIVEADLRQLHSLDPLFL